MTETTDTPKVDSMLRELECEQLKASQQLNIVISKARSLERSCNNSYQLIDRFAAIIIGGIGDMTEEQARSEYGEWASAVLAMSRKWKEV